MNVTGTDTTQLTPQYQVKDFYSHSLDAPTVHYLDDRLVTGFQIINDFLGVRPTPTSTFRTYLGNLTIGGAGGSQHLTGHAADGDVPDAKLREYNDQISTRGPLYLQLKAAGINGFGLYDNFFHIDTRDIETHWDNRADTPTSTITQALASSYYNDEDGIKDWERTLWIIGLSILFLVLLFLLFKYVL